MSDRSEPFDDIAELFDRLSQQLETAARSWDAERGTELGDRGSRFDLSMRGSATNLDLTDEGDEFVVTVDVPGYDTGDLEIRLSGETLSIRGEREHEEHGGDGEQYIRRERAVQSFSRQVHLPDPVEADDVTATVNNGILAISLPKREPSDESTSIDIE